MIAPTSARYESERSSIRIQSALVTLARVLQAAFGLAVPIVLARILVQETFGHYREVILIITTGAAALSLCLPNSLYYLIPTAPEERREFHVQTATLLGIIGALGGAAIGLIALSSSDTFLGELSHYAVLLAVLVALAPLASFSEVAPVVDGRADLSVKLVGILDSLRGILVIGLALLFGHLLPVLGAIALVMLLRVCFLVSYVWRKEEREGSLSTRERLSRQLRYALPVYLGGLFGLARDQLHSYFVIFRSQAADFAVYAVGTLPVPFISQLTYSVGEVVILRNARLFNEGRVEELVELWHRAVHLLFIIIVPVIVALELYADALVVAFFGDGYAAAADVLRIYVLSVPLTALLTSSVLRALADLRLLVWGDVLSLLATVLFLVCFRTEETMLFAASSLIAGKLVFNAISIVRIAHRLELRPSAVLPWRKLAFVAVASALAGCVALVATYSLPGLAKPFVGGVVLAATYVAFVWGTGILPRSEREFLRLSWSRLRSWTPR